MAARALDDLIALLSKLPGLGPRSARRAALHLIKQRETLLRRLAVALSEAADQVQKCSACGNLDAADPCWICAAPDRDDRQICVVEEVDDLWALERSGMFRGRYHVLGGALSAIDGYGPQDLGIDRLIARVGSGAVGEVILATSATVDGQTTAHYIADRLGVTGVSVTRLAHGLPVGGELNYLDDGTLGAAFEARRPVQTTAGI
ncbi:MAG TPA: recombination mediator RecR [Geminicoccaceae bacterium]|jgi:recombination protein RecR|nr:recombination mediator RecR [Geminicoccaceae bacterium]